MFQASRTLVLLAHPHLDRSRVNAALAAVARESPGVLVHDLYAAYPDGGIDVGREQRLLGEHDLIVLQFPFYWYSVPPFLKQWLDEVLLEGYAYGEEATPCTARRSRSSPPPEAPPSATARRATTASRPVSCCSRWMPRRI